MDISIFKQLHDECVISDTSFAKIKLRQENDVLSVHWEIKTMLYLGVLLLSAGLGILVYKNIDTIGHQFVLFFIALICGGCFYYCFKNKLPYSTDKVVAPNSFFDYILLLGCCSFITFIAYLQFQYNVFGSRYGLATFFPMLLLFFCAYYFDHLGILSMAVVNLAAWVGITVTPLQILQSNDFNSSTIIFTGLALGTLLMLVAWASRKKRIKRHFEFTYANFGTHVLLISCLAAMIHFSVVYLVWFLILMGLAYFFYLKAIKDKSFYFILIITLYTYIGVSYVIINLLSNFGSGIAAIYLGFLYFIVSGILMVLFLVRTNKKLKQHDSI
ncbi:MAG: DUF2157 domain-containing protein [Ferruginibacter sp.]